eukprot:scaffold2441_cov121-Isochrysis_galbana.AAC.1
MELLRPPGREAAAAPTAAAICQEPRRSALAAANREASAAPAGPSCAGKAGSAAPSSSESKSALSSATRARCPPGCIALGPALGDVPTPTLPGTARQQQRARPPKLVFPIIMCPDKAGWARQRRLEPPASTDSAGKSFTSVEESSVLAVGACGKRGLADKCDGCRAVDGDDGRRNVDDLGGAVLAEDALELGYRGRGVAHGDGRRQPCAVRRGHVDDLGGVGLAENALWSSVTGVEELRIAHGDGSRAADGRVDGRSTIDYSRLAGIAAGISFNDLGEKKTTPRARGG